MWKWRAPEGPCVQSPCPDADERRRHRPQLASVGLYLAACLVVAGCTSHKGEADAAIGRNQARAVVIDQQATAINSDLNAALETGEVGPLAVPFVDSAKGRATKIQSEAKGIQKDASAARGHIQQTQDITPWWASLLGNLAWVVILVVAVGALWYTGIFSVIRAWIPILIPNRIKSQAKLDLEALEHPEVLPQAVALRREDPMYNAAFKAEKKKETQ